MTLSNLEVRVRLIEAKTAQLEAQKTQRAIAGIGTSTRTSGKQAAEGSSGFDTLTSSAHRLRTALAFAGGALGFGAIFYGIKDIIKAGTDWQAQQSQLQNALRNTGHAGAGAMNALNAAIDSSSTKGGFSPAEEAQGLANFIRETGSASAAIKLNTEAINLARGAHLGYSQALRLVQQAQTGAVGRLGRLIGPVLAVTTNVNALTAAQKRQYPQELLDAKLADKRATALKINTLLMDKFRGATAAYGRTAAGAISNAQNTFALLTEQIARTVLPLITKVGIFLGGVALSILHSWPAIKSTIVAVFTPILSVIRWLGGMKTVLLGIVAAFTLYKVATLAAAAVTAIQTATFAGLTLAELAELGAVGSLTLAWSALTAAMLANPIGLIIIAIIAIGTALYEAYRHCKVFREIIDTTFRELKIIVGDVVQFVKQHWQLMLTVLTLGIAAIPIFVATHFNQIVSFVSSLPRKIGRAAVGLWDGLKHGLIDVLNWIIGKLNWLIRAADNIPFVNIGQIGLIPNGTAAPSAAAARPTTTSATQAATTTGVIKHLANRAAAAAGAAPGAGGTPTIQQAPITLTLNGMVLAKGMTHAVFSHAAASGINYGYS